MALGINRSHAPRLLAVSAFALLLAACGGGTTATGTPAASVAASRAPASAAPSAAASVPAASQGGATGGTITKATTAKGDALVAPNGMTLYIWDKDTAPNKSTCSGQCLSNWPLMPGNSTAGAGVTGTIATFTRDDGTAQASYNGKPLYFFAGDQKAGDANGDGVGGTWHLAKP